MLLDLSKPESVLEDTLKSISAEKKKQPCFDEEKSMDVRWQCHIHPNQ